MLEEEFVWISYDSNQEPCSATYSTIYSINYGNGAINRFNHQRYGCHSAFNNESLHHTICSIFNVLNKRITSRQIIEYFDENGQRIYLLNPGNCFLYFQRFVNNLHVLSLYIFCLLSSLLRHSQETILDQIETNYPLFPIEHPPHVPLVTRAP